MRNIKIFQVGDNSTYQGYELWKIEKNESRPRILGTREIFRATGLSGDEFEVSRLPWQ